MANSKPEILPFAVDNAADCESYLFLNHPTSFVPLTADLADEHHSPPLSPKSTPTITNPNHITTSHPSAIQRKSSTTSTSSSINSSSSPQDDDFEGYLGGGALRHLNGSHHLRDLAERAALDAEAKARRTHAAAAAANTSLANRGKGVVKKSHGAEAKQESWLASVMQWWPENMEMAEHEWTEEFYE
jgi:hypothetical protein